MCSCTNVKWRKQEHLPEALIFKKPEPEKIPIGISRPRIPNTTNSKRAEFLPPQEAKIGLSTKPIKPKPYTLNAKPESLKPRPLLACVFHVGVAAFDYS